VITRFEKTDILGRNIVFINQATGYLTIDVINVFAGEFGKVELVTGSIRVQDTELDPKVKISWIYKYNRGNNFKKAFSWIIATLQIFWLLKTRYRKFEVIFYTVPPTAYLLSSYITSSYSIIIFDLYPEALKIKGFTENGLFFRWWAKKNNRIFSKAHKIITLSDSIKKQVLNYSPDADVRVISNWSAFSSYKPVKKESNPIITREGLKGKFIIQYSGNIGVTHNVETLIDLADSLRNHTDIVFQIIGRGERYNLIKDLIKIKGLNNCHLLQFRPDDELYFSLCAADIAVIILDDKTNDISIPSKTYNIMAAGIPIMAIAPRTSGLTEIISLHEAGKSFEKNQLSEMSDYIINLKNDKLLYQSLSDNSLLTASNYTKENALKYFKNYVGFESA